MQDDLSGGVGAVTCTTSSVGTPHPRSRPTLLCIAASLQTSREQAHNLPLSRSHTTIRVTSTREGQTEVDLQLSVTSAVMNSN